MTSDMLWHTVIGPISWDIEFVLSTSPIQQMFCNEYNDIKWMNPLGGFSAELLYLLFQKCEICLFSLPNVAVWRDWLITFQPQHVWTLQSPILGYLWGIWILWFKGTSMVPILGLVYAHHTNTMVPWYEKPIPYPTHTNVVSAFWDYKFFVVSAFWDYKYL